MLNLSSLQSPAILLLSSMKGPHSVRQGSNVDRETLLVEMDAIPPLANRMPRGGDLQKRLPQSHGGRHGLPNWAKLLEYEALVSST